MRSTSPNLSETGLERLVEEPDRSEADLRRLEAACCALKEDAKALVAMLIARDTDEDLVTEAEVLFHYFGEVEAQIASVIDAGRT
jgi:hypothetical protein